MNKWLLFWLIFVAGWYLIPWWNRVYFLWDDIELLMQLRHPTLETFLASHQYQFFPVFLFLYSLETNLFGVNPGAFLTVSVGLHVINIWLVYILINKLTKNNLLSLLASVLVSFNKSYFTVVFWPTIQSNILLTTWLLLALLLFLELKHKLSLNKLAKFITLILLAGLSFGFGIGAGFIFSIAAWLFIRNRSRLLLTISSLIVGVATALILLKFSLLEVQQAQVFSLSGSRLFNITYFTAVGISQGIISRFFIPGFVPNIYNASNIVIMIVLPAAILLFFIYTAFSMIKKHRLADLLPLFLFVSLFIMPYFIASLARSGPGALGGLAERYVYLPFFTFILALIYSCYLITDNKLSKNPFKLLLLIILLIIGFGHQITLYPELNQLFL